MGLKVSEMLLAFWGFFFSSFEFDDLNKMWYSDAVAVVESAGWTSEMKTDAVLWYSK